MTPEEWINALRKTYDFQGASLTEDKKHILLTSIKIPEEKQENLNTGEYQFLVKNGLIPLEDEIPEEYRSTTEELKEILIKDFFTKVSREEAFGDENRIEEKQRDIFKRYQSSHKPFVDMSRTFLTFSAEIRDLFPNDYNLVLSQILNSVFTTIKGVFFPSDGPYKHSIKERIKTQEELLITYAPTFDRQGFFKNNPILEELRAKEAKWSGVVYIIICLVIAWFIPQEEWWGKIIFWALMAIVVLCLCSPICKRIIFSKANKEKS